MAADVMPHLGGEHGADGHAGGASQLFGYGLGDPLRIEFEPGPASGNLL